MAMLYCNNVAHGIMFHHFHDAKHPKGQGSISSDDLDKLLNYIGIQRFLSPSEWLEKLEKNRLQEKDVCLTFDDGLLCQREVALPVLEHYRLQAFWFVYSSVFEGKLENLEIYRFFRTKFFQNIDQFYAIFLKRVLDSEFAQAARDVFKNNDGDVKRYRKHFPFHSMNDIQFRLIRDRVLGKQNYERIMDAILLEYRLNKSDLAANLWMSDSDLKYLHVKGHAIGLHSYSHPTTLADLSYQDQFEEYQKNYSHLKKVCGISPSVMSHPGDSYNGDTIKILREFGIRCGFQSNILPKDKSELLNARELEIVREDHANIMRAMQGTYV